MQPHFHRPVSSTRFSSAPYGRTYVVDFMEKKENLMSSKDQKYFFPGSSFLLLTKESGP